MQDNSAYARYVNQTREVLLNTLRARGEFPTPEPLVDVCLTLLQRRWSEIGLTPDVFNPFLEQHMKGKASAMGAGAIGSPLTDSGATRNKV